MQNCDVSMVTIFFFQKSFWKNLDVHFSDLPSKRSANRHCVTEKSCALYFSTRHFATCRNRHSKSTSTKSANYPLNMQIPYSKPYFILSICAIFKVHFSIRKSNLFTIKINSFRNFLNITAWKQCVKWTKILTRQQDRLLIKVTRPVLLGQQILPWRPITIAINLTCPQDRLLKM